MIDNVRYKTLSSLEYADGHQIGNSMSKTERHMSTKWNSDMFTRDPLTQDSQRAKTNIEELETTKQNTTPTFSGRIFGLVVARAMTFRFILDQIKEELSCRAFYFSDNKKHVSESKLSSSAFVWCTEYQDLHTLVLLSFSNNMEAFWQWWFSLTYEWYILYFCQWVLFDQVLPCWLTHLFVMTDTSWCSIGLRVTCITDSIVDLLLEHFWLGLRVCATTIKK